MPDVTILMAVYNGLPYLPLSIESILNQTYDDFEFLIVDDCSTDETCDVIEGYGDPRIRLLRNEVNMKQTLSLNRGLEHTRTDLVARMDDDDVSHSRRIEKQVSFLESHPDVGVVGSDFRLIDEAGSEIGRELRPESDLGIRWMQFFTCPIANGASMFRKSLIWDKLGGYDGSIQFSQDWELWSRVPKDSKLRNLPEFLLDVRKHPGQESVNISARTENQGIFRKNPERMLGIAGDRGYRFLELDLFDDGFLDWGKNPNMFLEFVRCLFRDFEDAFQGARQNSEIRRQVSDQLYSVASWSSYRHPATTLLALKEIWSLTTSKWELIKRMARKCLSLK